MQSELNTEPGILSTKYVKSETFSQIRRKITIVFKDGSCIKETQGELLLYVTEWQNYIKMYRHITI